MSRNICNGKHHVCELGKNSLVGISICPPSAGDTGPQKFDQKPENQLLKADMSDDIESEFLAELLGGLAYQPDKNPPAMPGQQATGKHTTYACQICSYAVSCLI